jgi:hypothetical protein|tara:strand:+ start:424 stop:609 length:186 start_codon:yes stop_codon:yes gene_type:complete
MNQEERGKQYDLYLSEYHRLENQIGQIKMNKFDLNGVDEKEIRLLERKKKYIMGRVDELSM